ncbi:HAD family hydrolase [Salinivibrio costicola]|uniref:HAD family hydrolase n=1 Tax=Salinivibrio costicola TaxID=51367 RepID=UPI003F727C62
MTVPINIAFFDLDETLVATDTKQAWLEYLCQHDLAPQNVVDQEKRAYLDFKKGRINLEQYMQVQLISVKGKSIQTVAAWATDFIDQHVAPVVVPQALARIEWHRNRGDHCVLVSNTATHLARPIGKLLKLDTVIAIELETLNGVYTGSISHCVRDYLGKHDYMQAWLSDRHDTVGHTYGYSDSHWDVPLLEQVDSAFAVNPDPHLSLHAQEKDWTIMEWARYDTIRD